MPLDLETLLAVRFVRALDIDADGRVLAGADIRGTMQLIEIATDGGITELTALDGACIGRYIPGQRAVIVTHDEGGNENGQLSVLRLDPPVAVPAKVEDLTPLVRDPRFVHRMLALDEHRIAYITNRRDRTGWDVVLRDLATGEEMVGYQGDRSIGDVALSPDGARLAVTVTTDRPMSAQLLLIDLADGAVRELTGDDEHAAIGNPAFTPDGDALLVTTNRDRDFDGVARIHLGTVDLGTPAWDWLVTDDTADLTGMLSPDGATLLIEANVGGASRCTLHDAHTGAHLRDVALPARGPVVGHPLPPPRWSPDSGAVVASITSPEMPGDALRIDVATGAVTALSDSARYLGGIRLAAAEEHLIPALDGESIPCLVYRPDHDNGASVIWIHGGPEGQSKRSFNAFVQALAQSGYTVIVPNVRGSVGYGKRWYSLDDVRLRLNSVADLAAIHAHLPALGLDQSRVALFGGSYGGYMVLAGLAFQPELWTAGVDIVGISSLLTFLENTAPYRRAAREREYGSLEHDRDFLIEASPMTRVDAIRAPLFMIHGENDPRVPVSEARQLHAAVVANGVECELLTYHDEGHGLAKKVNQLDAYPKAFAFLNRHLLS